LEKKDTGVDAPGRKIGTGFRDCAKTPVTLNFNWVFDKCIGGNRVAVSYR